MVALFRKRCWFCSEKIDKGKEHLENSKTFCSAEHAKSYAEKLESTKQGGCCGSGG